MGCVAHRGGLLCALLCFLSYKFPFCTRGAVCPRTARHLLGVDGGLAVKAHPLVWKHSCRKPFVPSGLVKAVSKRIAPAVRASVSAFARPHVLSAIAAGDRDTDHPVTPR